jgi:hypothetical protein
MTGGHRLTVGRPSVMTGGHRLTVGRPLTARGLVQCVSLRVQFCASEGAESSLRGASSLFRNCHHDSSTFVSDKLGKLFKSIWTIYLSRWVVVTWSVQMQSTSPNSCILFEHCHQICQTQSSSLYYVICSFKKEPDENTPLGWDLSCLHIQVH